MSPSMLSSRLQLLVSRQVQEIKGHSALQIFSKWQDVVCRVHIFLLRKTTQPRLQGFSVSYPIFWHLCCSISLTIFHMSKTSSLFGQLAGYLTIIPRARMGSEWIAHEKRRNIFNEHSRVSCHQKEISFKLVFQFLSVWAETLHDNRTSYFQQSYVFGFLLLTVVGAKMTS